MKILETNKTPLDIFCEASDILNQAVQHTLGPKGTNTALQNKQGQYEIINDGKTIIESITSLDPAIAPALETLKQASFETNNRAGDGTTSTTVIMNALLQGARKYLKDHPEVSKVDLRNILETVKDNLLTQLDNNRIELTEADYKKVATVALGSDKYSDELADVFTFLGKDKKPTLIKSNVATLEIEKIDGINLTKTSIVSSLFSETSEHKRINIICLFQPVNRFNEITQLLRKVQQAQGEQGEFILFYNQLSTDILENLLFNYTSGALKLIPISLGGYGKGTYSIMEELADYCDTSVIDGINIKVGDINKIKFGLIDYCIISPDQVILKAGDKNSEKLEKNYVHLEQKSVIIRVGGTNVIEREEVYRRIEDAVNSLYYAIQYGIVLGAGQTYSTLIELSSRELNNIPGFIITAMNIIKNTVNISDSNIYDSAMVIKEVITNAFSIVSQVITTQVVIHENIR